MVEQPDARKLVEDILKFLEALRRGWRLIAICVLGTLALAALYLARDKPVYQASAHLLVLQHGGRPIAIDNGATNHAALLQSVDGYSNSLATHVMIICSPAVVEQALVAAGLKNLSADSVLKKLSVKVPDEAARVVEITYRSDSRDEAGRVVDSVIKSYDRFLHENYQRNSTEVLSLISKARDEMSEELKKLEKEYLDYRRQSTRQVTDGEGRPFIARRLDQWDQTINKAVIRSIQLKSQLDLGRKMAENGAEAGIIAQGLNQLTGLGGEAAISPVLVQSGGLPGEPVARLEAELGEARSRRETAELLLQHLRDELVGTKRSGGTDDEETLREFHAEPETAALTEELGTARDRYNQAKRTTRRESDASVVYAGQKVKQLEAEIKKLWLRRKPSLAARSGGAGSDQVRQAESELIALRARESALGERLERVKAERVGRFRQELERLVKQYGPNHPRAEEVRGQIARIEGKSDDAASPKQAQASALLASIEQGLKSVEEIQAEIVRRFEKDLTESRKAEIGTLTEANLRNNLDRQRALFFSVVDQLKQAQLVSDFGTVTAQVLNPPSVTVTRSSIVLYLFAALVFGCGLGAASVYVVDLVDARVQSVPDIRRLMRLRILGQIMQLPREQPGAKAVGILCHSEPRSGLAESYKSIRTGIDLLRRNWNGQVILVTSPQPGEGKSMTASNLAISLAQSGRKVLLVDADLRQPSLHHTYGLRRRAGLTQVLSDRLPLCLAVQPTPIDNLDLLAAGPDAPNPAELLATQRLVAFMEETRRAYEIVVIDSSPLLAVTDPSLIAAVSDGILLVVRESVTRRHDVEQTLELLGTLGTDVLGVVVNGVKPGRLGYRYAYRGGSYGRASARGDEGPADDEPPDPDSDSAGLPTLTADRDGHVSAGFSSDPMS